MVFLIQNAQNRDARAIHIKLDELIKSTKNARNAMVDIEELPGDELEKLHTEFKEFHEKCAKELIKRGHKISQDITIMFGILYVWIMHGIQKRLQKFWKYSNQTKMA